MSWSYQVRHLAGGTVRVFLAEALVLPTGLITAAYLTRNLGPEGYGLFTLAAALIAWLSWTSTSLIGRASVKLVSEADDWRPIGATVLRVYLISGVGLALLVGLTAELIATLLAKPQLTPYLQLFAVELLLFSLTQAHRNILVGTGSYSKRALAAAVRWPVRLLLIVALVEMGLSVPGAILGSVAATAIELAVYRRYVRPSLHAKLTFPARQLFKVAVPVAAYGLCLGLFQKIDLFALSALGGSAADAGYYGAAQNLCIVPAIFTLSFSPLLLASLGRLQKAGEHSRTRAIARDVMRLIFAMLPFAGMTAGAARDIVILIFGSQFGRSAPLLALLMFAGVALVMIYVATVIMTVAEKPGWAAALATPVLLAAIMGHILLIPRAGAIGAATVTTTLAGAGALISMYAVFALWRVHPGLGTMARSVLLCGLAYLTAVLVPGPGIWVVPKLVIIMLLIPAGFVLLGELSGPEQTQFRSFIRRCIPLNGASSR